MENCQGLEWNLQDGVVFPSDPGVTQPPSRPQIGTALRKGLLQVMFDCGGSQSVSHQMPL